MRISLSCHFNASGSVGAEANSTGLEMATFSILSVFGTAGDVDISKKSTI